MIEARPRKIFYGWWVVLTAAIGLLLGYAPIFVFSFGVFVKSFVKEFHSNRTQISMAFTLANVMASFGAPLAGRFVDRFGARRVILPATLIFGVLLICFKFVSTSLWQLYVIFLALGFIGGGATAPVPYLKVVSNWFDRKRGLALGSAMVGIGIGAIAMPPLTQRLIAMFDWRSTYAILGGVVLLLSLLIVGLFLKDKPAELGLLPDGEVINQAGSEKIISDQQGITWRAARTSSTFWLMAAAFSLVGAGAHACVIHLVSMLTDRGIGAEKAALASSALGFAFLGGRLISGYLLDRYFGPYVAISFFGGVAIGLSLLLIGNGGAATFVGASLVGLGMGAEGDLMAYLASRYFGLRFFGEIFGYLFSTFTLAGALGPLLMGVGFDRTGSYRTPLVFFLMAALVAVGLMMRAGPYRYRPS